MASPDPPHGHAPPAPPAVAGDRLISVLRAGGCEAATGHQAEERAERHPIDSDERERCRRHCPQLFAHNISISWRSLANSASLARARATITTSRPPVARVTRGRTSSRNRRLILFRTTALPSFRLTARPTRGRPTTLSLTNTARYSEAARRPERRVRSKSAERSSRACRFNATEPGGYRARRLAVGVSRRRPLRRRALMTLTPPGLDMRARNPWTLTRWRFFGWWVRFMTVAGSGR